MMDKRDRVTERKRAEEELRKHQEHLEKVVEERTSELQQEITERKRAEESLRESEALFRAVFETTTDSIFIKDRALRYTHVNPAMEELFGVTAEELVNKTDVDIFGKEAGKHVMEMDGRVLAGEVIVEEPTKPVHGIPHTFHTIKTPFKDSEGNVIGLCGIARDTTERKRLEEQIRESLERRGRQVQTSTEIAQEIAAATALDELYRRVVTLVKERFGYYHAQIFRYDPELNAMRVVEGYGEVGEKMKAAGHNLPYGRGVVGTAASTGEAVLSSDVSQDSYWTPNPDLPDTWGELAVPIKLRKMEDGEWRDEVLGVLDVQSDTAGALSEEDQVLLLGLAGQIASAIESTRLLKQTEAALSEVRILYRFGEVISREVDLQAVYDAAARLLVEELDHVSSWIALVD